MKSRLLNLGLLLSSLVGYLEWGTDQKMFLIQGEFYVISKLFTDPTSVLYPLTLLPLAGQLILLYTLIQKQPNKIVTLIGIGLRRFTPLCTHGWSTKFKL